MLGMARDPEADRDRHGRVGERVAHVAAQPLGDREGARRVGARQDHGELLAADARGRVDLAHALAQQRGDLLEDRVADVVAGAVVDLLEVVEVACEHAHRRAAAARAAELEVEQLAEAAAVRQPGERIGAGGVRQLHDQLLDVVAHHVRHGRRDRHRRDAHAPPGGGAGLRRAREHQRAVEHGGERHLGERDALGEEVRRVEEHPQVEEDKRARRLRGEPRDAGHEQGAPREQVRQRRRRQALRLPQHRAADRERVQRDRQQARHARVAGMGKGDRHEHQRRAREVEAREHAHADARLEGGALADVRDARNRGHAAHVGACDGSHERCDAGFRGRGRS